MKTYKNRYQADKARRNDPKYSGDEKIIKVCGGYVLMNAWEYDVWRKQK